MVIPQDWCIYMSMKSKIITFLMIIAKDLERHSRAYPVPKKVILAHFGYVSLFLYSPFQLSNLIKLIVHNIQ